MEKNQKIIRRSAEASTTDGTGSIYCLYSDTSSKNDDYSMIESFAVYNNTYRTHFSPNAGLPIAVLRLRQKHDLRLCILRRLTSAMLPAKHLPII